MAAKDKKTTIVIKKITVVSGGAHGGSWKVAFADFMTAMMAFFLVMWLVNQTEEVKKSVAEYFSTPSIIEYNFSNFGVELTLEKLFLDLVNEPLKAFEQFVMPADKKPNVMDMGMKKIQVYFVTGKLGEYATNVDVTSDQITFDIPEDVLFKPGTSDPTAKYPEIMERVREIVEGLKDSNIYLNSELPYRGSMSAAKAKLLAEERLDYVMSKVQHSITHESVDMYGKTTVEKAVEGANRDNRGYIRFKINQKDKPKIKEDKARDPQSQKQTADNVDDVYNDFIENLTRKAEGRDTREFK